MTIFVGNVIYFSCENSYLKIEGCEKNESIIRCLHVPGGTELQVAKIKITNNHPGIYLLRGTCFILFLFLRERKILFHFCHHNDFKNSWITQNTILHTYIYQCSIQIAVPYALSSLKRKFDNIFLAVVNFKKKAL